MVVTRKMIILVKGKVVAPHLGPKWRPCKWKDCRLPDRAVGTRTLGMCIDSTGPVVVYADARDDNHGKATTGTISSCGGSALGWSPHKQDIATLSMTEAEYVAAAAGTQEATWISHLVAEATGMLSSSPPELRINSEGARNLANNPAQHPRTKHIDHRHHSIRDQVKGGDIEVSWVPGMHKLPY